MSDSLLGFCRVMRLGITLFLAFKSLRLTIPDYVTEPDLVLIEAGSFFFLVVAIELAWFY
jgi:hypothetical protein